MSAPNSTTLFLNPAIYTLGIEAVDNLAMEFFGNALEVTNPEAGDQIEVLFEGANHKSNSEAFVAAIKCFEKR